jgi:hypothetical protein
MAKAMTLGKASQRPAAYYERLRERIQAGQIVSRVQRCALGEIEMTSIQFQAAKLLINKTIPDLPTTQHEGGQGAQDVSGISPQALLALIEGRRNDTVTVEPDE